MKALIIYESMYGNTRAVAEAVAAGLRTAGEAKTVSAAEVQPDDFADVDLLVVGAPTHVHGLPYLASRKSAQKAAESSHGRLALEPDAADNPGVRAVLHRLPAGGGTEPPRRAAAFDTRLAGPELLTGSAGHAIARRLRHHGYVRAVPPASFFVDHQDRLLDGQVDRAEAWGRTLAAQGARPGSGS